MSKLRAPSHSNIRGEISFQELGFDALVTRAGAAGMEDVV